MWPGTVKPLSTLHSPPSDSRTEEMAGIATYSSTRRTSSVRARSELSPNSTRKMPVSTRTDNARNDLELRVESEHPEQGLGAMDTTTGSIYIICAKQSTHRELRHAVECHVQPRDPTYAVLLIDNGPPRCHHAQHPFHPSRQSTCNPQHHCRARGAARHHPFP